MLASNSTSRRLGRTEQIDRPGSFCLKPAEKPLVSVTIAAYNAAAFLWKSIHSVLKQTVHSWEIVIVDDGSTDETAAVLRQVRKYLLCNRLALISHPSNLGLSRARNSAIRAARGEFIAILDADDHWDPEHLADLIWTQRREAADLVYGAVSTFDNETGRSLGVYGPTPDELSNFPSSIFGRNFIAPSGVMYRRSLHRRVGEFNPSFQCANDFDMWLRIVNANLRIAYSGRVTTWYRKNNPGALTRHVSQMMEEQAMAARENMTSSIVLSSTTRRWAAAHSREAAAYTLPISLRTGLRHWLCYCRLACVRSEVLVWTLRRIIIEARRRLVR